MPTINKKGWIGGSAGYTTHLYTSYPWASIIRSSHTIVTGTHTINLPSGAIARHPGRSLLRMPCVINLCTTVESNNKRVSLCTSTNVFRQNGGPSSGAKIYAEVI